MKAEIEGYNPDDMMIRVTDDEGLFKGLYVTDDELEAIHAALTEWKAKREEKPTHGGSLPPFIETGSSSKARAAKSKTWKLRLNRSSKECGAASSTTSAAVSTPARRQAYPTTDGTALRNWWGWVQGACLNLLVLPARAILRRNDVKPALRLAFMLGLLPAPAPRLPYRLP